LVGPITASLAGALDRHHPPFQIVGVSRANLTQWETGRYLPSVENARLLDDHFRAANALVQLAEAARSPVTATAGVLTAAGSLLEVFPLGLRCWSSA
jgi:DNA-binding XRE family transcriptional regulator